MTPADGKTTSAAAPLAVGQEVWIRGKIIEVVELTHRGVGVSIELAKHAHFPVWADASVLVVPGAPVAAKDEGESALICEFHNKPKQFCGTCATELVIPHKLALEEIIKLQERIAELTAAADRARREGRLEQFYKMKRERPIDPTYWDKHEERDLKAALAEGAGKGTR
jgi:hypothetical protein